MLWLKEKTESWVPFSKYGSTTLTSDFLWIALNLRAGLLSSKHLGTRHLVQALHEAQAFWGSLLPWSLPAFGWVLVSPPRSHLPPERPKLQSCVGCVHVLCMWTPVCCALVHSENRCAGNITATIIQVRRQAQSRRRKWRVSWEAVYTRF